MKDEFLDEINPDAKHLETETPELPTAGMLATAEKLSQRNCEKMRLRWGKEFSEVSVTKHGNSQRAA